MDNSLLKLAPFVPLVKPIVETILMPKLEKLKKWLKTQEINGMVSDHIWYGDKFQDYLLRTYNKCFYINTLIFPNQQVKLNDLYYPLTIRSTKDNKKFLINEFKLIMLETYKKILICDSAGMGKSTLTRFMCLSLIEQKSLIPIYIELRKLSKENKLLDEIFSQIDPVDKQVSREFILKIIELGDFIFFFDGYDEIPSHSQEFVNNELMNFVNKADNNYFILTSRPDDSLTSFGNFQLFNVQPLEIKHSYKLLLKFDEVGKADTSVNLIKDIEASNQNVKEFLSNPFLCSLLYRSYSFSKDIPSKKVTFYNEVYTALFKSHDLSKDAYKRPKHSNLDEHDFRLVLREFAILTVKQGEVDYDYPTLLSYLTLSKENLKNIQFEEAKFVADLLGTVPLFVKDGNRIKWAHKSLQDYFAAEYISFNSQKEQILTRIYNTQNLKYLNIIDLIFELDYKSSRKTIIYLTIKDYQNYFDGSFTKFKDFPIDLINHRKYLTYGLTIWLQKVDSFGGDTFTAIRKNIFKEFPEYKNIPLNATISAGLFCIAYNYSFKRNILDLLIYKGLIESFDIKNPPERFKLKEYIFFPQKPTLLDDSVNSVFNKKTRFEKINRFICNFVRNKYQYHRFRYKLVDISVCNQLINQIEDELKRDETIDVFGGY